MSSKSNDIKKVFKYLFFVIVFLTIAFVVKVEDFRFNSELDRVAIITDYVINTNQPKYYELATSIFDEAKNCNNLKCRNLISLKINENLKEMKGVSFYEGIYFIRINSDGDLEKMFLHGEFKLEKIDTTGEEKVFQFLADNNLDNLYLKGFRIDSIYSNMHYLNDYYSEAEIIVPIRTYDQAKIVGAIVKGYGD